jgi:uncharacterized membrane protein
MCLNCSALLLGVKSQFVRLCLLCKKKNETITVVLLLLLLLMMMMMSWLLLLLLCYFPKITIIYSKTGTRFFMKYN